MCAMSRASRPGLHTGRFPGDFGGDLRSPAFCIKQNYYILEQSIYQNAIKYNKLHIKLFILLRWRCIFHVQPYNYETTANIETIIEKAFAETTRDAVDF